MKRQRLDEREVANRLEALPEWKREGDHIVRAFEAKSVRAAVALIARMCDLAEGADHHPEVTWVYRKLRIALSTHDAGGITARDFHLARCIEDVLAESK